MKKIIIMGATSGLGLKVAEILASRGVPLGIAGRNSDVLRELKERFPANVVAQIIDVNSPTAPQDFHRLIYKLGGMDIYLHIAGIGYDNPELTPERECDIIRTDTEGFARMIITAYKYFLGRTGGGHIGAVTSVAGTNGIGSLAAYSASKKFDQSYLVALEQLSRRQKADIIFTDIRPGWTRTPLLKPGEKYPMLMEPDFVAVQIIKAMAKRRRVAVIDSRWAALCAVWRLIPDSLWTKINPPV